MSLNKCTVLHIAFYSYLNGNIKGFLSFLKHHGSYLLDIFHFSLCVVYDRYNATNDVLLFSVLRYYNVIIVSFPLNITNKRNERTSSRFKIVFGTEHPRF